MNRHGVLRRYVHGIGKFLKPASKQPQLEFDENFPGYSQHFPELAGEDQTTTRETRNEALKRTFVIEREPGQSFGFSLQSVSVGKKQKSQDQGDDYDDEKARKMTYVSKVDGNSPADAVDLRPGDVIVMIDGHLVIEFPHKKLVQLIQQKTKMQMTVVFENMVKKVELTFEYLNIDKQLKLKLEELEAVEKEEKRLMELIAQKEETGSESATKIDQIDDASSGFGDLSASDASHVSVKSSESWHFDEASVQFC